MTEIVISLARGPDGQPTGRIATAAGTAVAFTGWLDLIRRLEIALAALDPENPSPAG
jgi:hypothetical protein